MKQFFPKDAKKMQQEKEIAKSAKDRSVNRFQSNATRLEHTTIGNKHKSKKG
jgi:hypothetical protein